METEKKPQEVTYKATFKRYTLKEIREHCVRIEKLEKMSALLKELQDIEITPGIEMGEKSFKEGYLDGFEQATKAFSTLMLNCNLTRQEVVYRLYAFANCELRKWGKEITCHDTGYAYASPPIFNLDWSIKSEKEEETK